MKREEFEEDLKNIEKEKIVSLYELEFIEMKNNSRIYPDLEHLRFCLDNKFIYVINGSSVPYGQNFANLMRISSDHRSIAFPRNGVQENNNIKFRNPQRGDIVRVSIDNKIISETFIENVIASFNEYLIYFSTPLKTERNGFNLSYYDPKEFQKDVCSHSQKEGVYLKFHSEDCKHKSKYCNFSYKIPIKKIKNIKFKEA